MLTNHAKNLGLHPSCKGGKKSDQQKRLPGDDAPLNERLKNCKNKDEIVAIGNAEPFNLELTCDDGTRKELVAAIVTKQVELDEANNNDLP